MRTWGRIADSSGNLTKWVEVSTDANGKNDMVYLTALAQALQLVLGESPFYANYGLPAFQTIVTQVFPDYYVMQTQAQFAPFFASLTVSRASGYTSPTYNIQAITHSGAIINSVIAA